MVGEISDFSEFDAGDQCLAMSYSPPEPPWLPGMFAAKVKSKKTSFLIRLVRAVKYVLFGEDYKTDFLFFDEHGAKEFLGWMSYHLIKNQKKDTNSPPVFVRRMGNWDA